MKKSILVNAGLLVSIGILTACGDNNEQSLDESSSNESEINESNEEGSTEGLPEKSDFGSNDDSDDGSETNFDEGTTEDQLDLTIGDTGVIETNLNLIELTLNSVEFEESINGETPERESFIIANVTLKNLADDTLDIVEALDVIEITGGLDISGGSDYSHYYDAIEPLEGELESGQEIEGQLLFEEDEFDKYYIRVTEGLIAAGGAKNQAIWTFREEVAE